MKALLRTTFGLMVWVIVATAIAPPAPAAETGTPQGTLKAFFMAAAKADFAALERLCTGAVWQRISLTRDRGPEMIAQLKKFGGALVRVEDVKVDDDRATAVVVIDAGELWSAEFKKRVDAYVAFLKTIESKIQEWQKRAAFKSHLAEVAKGVLRYRARLDKVGRSWVLSDLK